MSPRPGRPRSVAFSIDGPAATQELGVVRYGVADRLRAALDVASWSRRRKLAVGLGGLMLVALVLATIAIANALSAADAAAQAQRQLVDQGAALRAACAQVEAMGAKCVVNPDDFRGPAGPQGVAGAQGPQGVQGGQGVQGANGRDGAAGATGAPGDAGAPGPAGDPGASGPPGPSGPAGPSGPGIIAGQPCGGIDGYTWQVVTFRPAGTFTITTMLACVATPASTPTPTPAPSTVPTVTP